MRARPTLFVAFLAGCAVALNTIGCKPPASAPLAPQQVPASGDAVAPQGEPAPRGEAPQPDGPELYGYFRIADPSGLLEEVSKKLVPPAAQAFLSESMIKTLIMTQLGPELMPDLLQHVDLSRPFGCVVASPKTHIAPLACALAYRGGVPQLIKDLGPEGYISGGPGFAAYKRGDNTFYLSSIDRHVVVAVDPDLVGIGREVLQNFVVNTPPRAQKRDVVATLFPAVIWKDAEAEIKQFTEQAQASSPSATGDTALDTYMNGSLNATLKTYKSFADLDEIEMWFDIGDNSVELGYRGQARAGTPAAKAYAALQAAGGVDPGLIELMPAAAPVIAAVNISPGQLLDDPMIAPYVDLLEAVDAASGKTKFKAVMVDSLNLWQEISAGPVAVALYASPKGAAGVGYAVAVKPGVDGRAKLREMFDKYTPAALGDVVAKYLRWEITKGAYKIDGSEVDVLTVRPTKQGMVELTKSSVAGQVLKVLGRRPEFKIAFTQRGDVLFMSYSARDDKGLLRKLIGASSKPSTRGRTALRDRLVSEHGSANLLILTNVAASLRLAGKVAPSFKPPALDGRLDDIVVSGSMTPKGKHEYVLRASQAFIDQLREL